MSAKPELSIGLNLLLYIGIVFIQFALVPIFRSIFDLSKKIALFILLRMLGVSVKKKASKSKE